MPVCQKMWQTLPFLMLFLYDVDKYVLEESYTVYFIDTNDKIDNDIDNLDYRAIGNFLIRW